jgi:hypothetical protein
MHEHKAELRQRVEARCQELQAELEAAADKGHPPERVEALNTELRIVEDALSGGWDAVGEVTSQQLARWLEATRQLVQETEEEQDFDERITAEIPAQHID